MLHQPSLRIRRPIACTHLPSHPISRPPFPPPAGSFVSIYVMDRFFIISFSLIDLTESLLINGTGSDAFLSSRHLPCFSSCASCSSLLRKWLRESRIESIHSYERLKLLIRPTHPPIIQVSHPHSSERRHSIRAGRVHDLLRLRDGSHSQPHGDRTFPRSTFSDGVLY